MKVDDKARKMLREAKLYCTEARIAILRVLMEAARPLRQDQIASQSVRGSLNKVTVYRTLESLIDVGLVHRAFTQDRTWHYELANHCSARQCHPHFTCTRCGVTHCLMEASVPLVKIAQKGFVISRQQVRLEGLCPACARPVPENPFGKA